MLFRSESAVTTPARRVAALIATSAWIGLIVQFHASIAILGSVLPTLTSLIWYFTILTNLLVAIVFTGIALGRASFSAPPLVASTTLYILLVGIIYGLLLHGLPELSGHSNIANMLLHMVTPAAVPLFWLLFTPKGHLQARHLLFWAIYPLGYLFYVIIRGEFTGRYRSEERRVGKEC